MGKACTIYKDIGKSCGDLLSKDFKVGKTTVELKSKTASGVVRQRPKTPWNWGFALPCVLSSGPDRLLHAHLRSQTFTPTATRSGDAVSGELKAEYGFLPWLKGEAVFGTSGSMTALVEASDAIAKGLTMSAECERAAPGKGLLASGNLILDYKQEAFTGKMSFDYYKKDLLGALLRLRPEPMTNSSSARCSARPSAGATLPRACAPARLRACAPARLRACAPARRCKRPPRRPRPPGG